MPNQDAPAGESSGNERPPGYILRDFLACGVIVIDAEGHLRTANARARELLDFTGDTEFSQKGFLDELRAAIEQSLSRGINLDSHELILRRPGVAERLLRLSTVVLPQGKGARLIGVLNDVTGVEQLEGRVQRLHRVASVGTSAAGMAHEIKNALVAVRTFIDLLIEQHPDNEMAEMASREVRRINSLASQMLKLAGPPKATFARVSLHDVLEHAFALIHVQLTHNHISLVRQLMPASHAVEADAYQLEQAFVNLFMNGIEAMGEGGRLTVSTDVAEAVGDLPGNASVLRITITDTGAGIAAENLGRLFDTFFTTKENGTGLGLTITRRIIREHGGDIQVRSELGKGTTFTVLLPRLAN